MLKNHPKGLLAASFSNMGERFGFYVMMAVLTLFLTSKFNFSENTASIFYSIFYASIYLLALVGGAIADRTKKYKGTIQIGIIIMALGYLLLAMPTPTPAEIGSISFVVVVAGLACIAFGNGLFKGNLQAVVGQMYDDPKYSEKRNQGFSLFYMFINVGAVFAPLIAVGMRNWWLKSNGFLYEAALPERCYKYMSGQISGSDLEKFQELATKATVSGQTPTDLSVFCSQYLEVFTAGYHYSFAIAIVAMLISVAIFFFNKKRFPDPAQKKAAETAGNAQAVEMSAQEVKQRLYALFAVFAVVFFFWLSFHQNGASLNFFAKDFINMEGVGLDLGFVNFKGIELFQAINPLFIVALTPILLGLFGWLRAKGKEPSTPKKIVIGMFIAAIAYGIMLVGSIGLPDASVVKGMSGGLDPALKVTPWLLVLTYFTLSVAELFISPLGIAFVSKVAPPKYQGMMQGGWLAATGFANMLLFVGTTLLYSTSLTITWGVFVGACLFSMFIMLFMLKWLERVAK